MNYVVKNNKYKILTPKGFRSFAGIKSLHKKEYCDILLSNKKSIKASLDHPFISNNLSILAKDLKIGDILDSNKEKITILDIKICQGDITLYDILEVDEGNIFNVNGIISHNCNFVTSGNTVIPPEAINWYEENTLQEPIERRGLDKGYWIWEYPDPLKYYTIIADVARGDGADFSAFQVFEMETITQVAEYKSQPGTREYAQILLSAATEYNNALLVIENASIGWDVVQSVVESGYQNVHYSYRSEIGMDFQKYLDKYQTTNSALVPGFSTTSKTKPLVIGKMRDLVENKFVTIRSLRLLEELRVFIWKNDSGAAMNGYNDDLVMSFAIGMYLRDTSLRYKTEADSLIRSSLNNFTKTDSGFQLYNANSSYNTNPWQMNIHSPNGEESQDLRWLL